MTDGDGRRILVTGAFGFVGTNLCGALRSCGYECDALDLRRGDASYSRFFSWDDLDCIPFGDYSAVVHLAGKAHDLRKVADEREYFDVNVGLLKKVFERAEGIVPRFIYFSSSKAAQPDTPYGRSKLAAEEYLAGRAIVLRPAMIHGPGNKGNLNLLFAFAKHGLPWPLASFGNKRSFASVGNVCAAVEGLVAGGENGVYPVADDDPVSTNRLIELISESCGRKARLWRLPKSLMTFAARVGDVLRLPLNTERLGKLTEDCIVDNTELKRALGWEKMPIAAEDGLRATLASFVVAGQ